MLGVKLETDDDALHSVTMPRPFARHRWIVWMAALAVLMTALAPTVSRWLAPARLVPLQLAEVCASQAGGPSVLLIKRVTDDTPGQAGMDHCALCVLQAHGLGLPPTVLSTPLLTALRHDMPTLFLHAPQPLHAWASALARAPPASRA